MWKTHTTAHQTTRYSFILIIIIIQQTLYTTKNSRKNSIKMSTTSHSSLLTVQKKCHTYLHTALVCHSQKILLKTGITSPFQSQLALKIYHCINFYMLFFHVILLYYTRISLYTIPSILSASVTSNLFFLSQNSTHAGSS